ncbi:hypothetical protein SPI_02997 [Niveomyces insectorum RCEF 264]|uniref:Uncharacterized protein n=1 Tax=Niveomyces insectorum RCEF 264 TaxID=1081102 RepID=A0A162MN01_9HYPO|nr:hypothetical protein SPI_02997 [Niveomyces insectorum RCEF 264]
MPSMPSRKPTLALTTPVTASFPADALKSAASVRTPHSAFSATWREPLPSAGLPSAGLPSAGLPSAGLASAGLHSPLVTIKSEDGMLKTPITPPLAWMDFLKLASPIAPSGSPCTSSPVTASAAAAAAAAAVTCPHQPPRPRALHRASISGPVKGAGASAANKNNAGTSGITSRSGAPPKVGSASVSASASSASLSSSSDEDSNDPGAEEEDKNAATDSGPSTAASSTSNATESCPCDCEPVHKSPRVARINTVLPPGPFSSGNCPMSAPAMGRTTFTGLKIPASPAVSNASQVASPIQSPFSARSTVGSHFDWEAALKARYAEVRPPLPSVARPRTCTNCTGKQPPAASNSTAAAAAAAATTTTSTSTSTSTSTTAPTATAARTSIRHIREVVTRTVTYTPRMNPAPKGKKRKMDDDDAAR